VNDKGRSIQTWVMGGLLLVLALLNVTFHERAIAQKSDGQTPADWVAEIEKIFIRSEDCKQCHDRHYEEWKGMREQTPDLKSFGRVDAALLHGTSFESPVFRTVLGMWMQTNPTMQERQRCLSCHAPAVTVFPQHVEKISAQILSGKPQVEGIGCASCHLINAVETTPQPPPTYKVQPGVWALCRSGREPGASGHAVAPVSWREFLHLLSFRQSEGCHTEGFAR